MRLITVKKFIDHQHIEFEEYYGTKLPDYAILSHTWEPDNEVIYQNCNLESSKDKTGYNKIRQTCNLAHQQKIDYIWVDTCCIDKSSSAELTEAINSMFLWYQQSKVCYVYLSDLHNIESLEDCRWFSRGWTLQELIAPTSMSFFDHSWKYLGSKKDFMDRLSAITKIDCDILSHKASLSSICIAKRLSWAADRITTRIEDMSYCLLGILNINMPMLYGEGHRAFRRLQEEIVRSSYDSSLFAWTPPETTSGDFSGFFAQSVVAFLNCSQMYSVTESLLDEGEVSVINKGVMLQAPEYIFDFEEGVYQYALKLGCSIPGNAEDFLAIPMRKIGPNTFIRARSRDSTASFRPQPVFYGENELRHFILLAEIPEINIPRPLLREDQDIISFSRFTEVQIKFPGNILQVDTSECPLKFWDVQDCLFFGTRGSLENWGAVDLGIGVVFVCFWYRQQSNWTLQGTLLKEDNWGYNEQYTQIFLFGEEFDYRMSSVREVLDKYREGPTANHTDIQLRTENGGSSVSFSIERLNPRSVQTGPRWKVEIFWNSMPKLITRARSRQKKRR